MAISDQSSETARFSIENIGGIDRTDLSIHPGVTILTGKNATNRTSLLQSVICAMGSDQVSLKSDADEGRVEMTLGDTTYRRTINRTEDGVSFEGDSYLDDPEAADLFAFLLEDNKARRAASQGKGLRDIIMQPVDTDAIQEEIRQIEQKKDQISNEIDRIESRKRKLPDVESRRDTIREKIDAKRNELGELEEKIDDSKYDIEQGQKEQAELESKLTELRKTRSELESVRRKIERHEESISSLQREENGLKNELDELPDSPTEDANNITSDINRLRTRRENLNAEINELRSLIQYNNDRLEAEDYELLDTAETEPDDKNSSPTDQLLESEPDTVVCWTCGSSVEHEQIESTVNRLASLRTEKVEELNEVNSQLDELKEEQRKANNKKQRRSEIKEKIEEIDNELDRRRDQIDTFKDKRESLTDDVQSLESEAESLESADFDEVLSLHKEANQLEFEIERLESDLSEVKDEVETIEADIDRAKDLRVERDELAEELTHKRTKIKRIEEQAIDSFNDHMESILNLLNYNNIERIWIESIEEPGRGGNKTRFEQHIVRTTENGAAYEDTIDHLSESEREVTGLIFALAGYLVHDLHEVAPFIVLDSLETIDSDRIASLVQYFADYAEFLVVALLPEDAQALDDDFTRVKSF
jgi:uncharacterized coiled-coil DUF342 family protein